LLPDGERLKILEATAETGKGEPGVILNDRLTVATGDGALLPLVVQRQGKRAMETVELLRGLALKPGDRLS
jgi:methionyl-tRNA formyltransferase